MNLSNCGLPVFVPETYENSWVVGESSEDYHSDKSCVSSSALRKILKSPASYISYLQQSPKESIALRFGSLFHMALLEPEIYANRCVFQPDFGDLRSPKNREKRDEWKDGLSANAFPITEDENIKIQGMLKSVASHPDASATLRNGQAEVSGYYRDPISGLKCKIKPDFLNHDMMILLDVKTTQDCSFESFQRTIISPDYRYDVQLAMYCEGIRAITGKLVEYPMFLTIEKEPPYECAVYLCDKEIMQRGRQDYEKAMRLLAECLKKNHWPPYQTVLQTIELPRWAQED